MTSFQRTARGTSALFEEVAYEIADEDYASAGGVGNSPFSRVLLPMTGTHGRGGQTKVCPPRG